MSSVEDWLAEAHTKGREWYQRHVALSAALGTPPFTLKQCQDHARLVADTPLIMDWIPEDAEAADKARFVAEFVRGAVTAWREQR